MMHQITTLLTLALWQRRSQWQRFRRRLRTPRGRAATLAIALFLIVYLVGGLTVISRREPADPENLRHWLSGGMVLYTLYHLLKQFWASPGGGMAGSGATTSREALDSTDGLGFTSASDSLWLGGGPIDRRLLVIRQAICVIPATAVKALLLVVVLAIDVPSWIGLASGVFLCLLSVEWARRILTALVGGLSNGVRQTLRVATTLTAMACVVHLGCITFTASNPSKDPAHYALAAMAGLGELTHIGIVQTLAMPLQPAAHLAVGHTMQIDFLGSMRLNTASLWIASLLFPIACLVGLVSVDRWVGQRRIAIEREMLRRGLHRKVRAHSWSRPHKPFRVPVGWGSESMRLTINDAAAITLRQWHCVRGYWANVTLSFAIPMALSLSPLVTDQTVKQWVFVIGGIALSSLLLAPPALQIDFRRDWKRLPLLRSLPIGPLVMGLGMLSVPVAITVAFQWSTLGIAAWLVGADLRQTLWLALALPSLAVIGFAIENALFLMFPHRSTDQGIAMVIRTKATFLWKAFLLAACPAVLLGWTTLCRAVCSPGVAPWATSIGSLTLAWVAATCAVATLVMCWANVQRSHESTVEAV